MGKSAHASKEEAELLHRLQDLESQIKKHDESQIKLRYISLCGIGIITCLMLTFLYRIYNYVDNYDIQQVVETLRKEAPAVLEPELDALVYELSTDIFPIFSNHLIAKFRDSMPELRQSGLELASQLEGEIRKRAEERLLESLVTGLENSGDEIRNIFPEFSAEVLEEQIGRSMGYYVERLHDSIEDRLALVIASLEDLRSTAGQIGKTKGLEAELPINVGEAESDLIEALLDLVVYEIKPELGSELAEVD